jgi:hypothetical protein
MRVLILVGMVAAAFGCGGKLEEREGPGSDAGGSPSAGGHGLPLLDRCIEVDHAESGGICPADPLATSRVDCPDPQKPEGTRCVFAGAWRNYSIPTDADIQTGTTWCCK